jgi:hypothetical protein
MNKIIEFNDRKFDFYSLLFKYYSNKYNSLKSFENIHDLLYTNDITSENKNFYIETPIPIMGSTDRRSVFVSDFYQLFDQDYEFLNLYLNFVKFNIKPLFPNEKILVQKTPNIRFHLPNCSNIGKRDTDKFSDIIGLHCDHEFGHQESEINIVLPITKMYDTNSIFYEPYPDSNLSEYNFNNLKLNKNFIFIGNLNKCKHYNKINNTNQTRVSFDFRIIPYSKFKKTNSISETSNTKFELGNYYMLF